MANKYGKAIDKTFLSLDTFEDKGQIHRDYIAHCLRWTHVAKYAARKAPDTRILDIGCGKEFPLPRLIRSGMIKMDYYSAVDYAKIEPKKYFNKTGTSWEPQKVWSETDFCEIPDEEHDNINTICCFEVLEHVEPEHAQRMLQKMKRILAKDGIAFLSTPCYDEKVGAAANHVNEMTYEAFGSLIESTGLGIKAHYGTFASQKDYKKILTDDELSVFNKLNVYYDANYLSTIFAPLYPAHSRNAIWEVIQPDDNYKPQFPKLNELTGTVSNSEHWNKVVC
jgi:SAM-dependent methyltransferase